MNFRRGGALAAVLGAALLLATVLLAVDSRHGASVALLDEYDVPFVGKTKNDMVDSSMGRHFAYSQGDQDVREGTLMTTKFNRLQSIIDSIHNGPLVPNQTNPPPPQPKCGEPGGPICPHPRGEGTPFLSYTQRIRLLLEQLQSRINTAAKRQYRVEDMVATTPPPILPPPLATPVQAPQLLTVWVARAGRQRQEAAWAVWPCGASWLSRTTRSDGARGTSRCASLRAPAVSPPRWPGSV